MIRLKKKKTHHSECTIKVSNSFQPHTHTHKHKFINKLYFSLFCFLFPFERGGKKKLLHFFFEFLILLWRTTNKKQNEKDKKKGNKKKEEEEEEEEDEWTPQRRVPQKLSPPQKKTIAIFFFFCVLISESRLRKRLEAIFPRALKDRKPFHYEGPKKSQLFFFSSNGLRFGHCSFLHFGTQQTHTHTHTHSYTYTHVITYIEHTHTLHTHTHIHRQNTIVSVDRRGNRLAHSYAKGFGLQAQGGRTTH